MLELTPQPKIKNNKNHFTNSKLLRDSCRDTFLVLRGMLPVSDVAVAVQIATTYFFRKIVSAKVSDNL